MCRNTAHGRHIICVFVEVQCVSSHFFLIYGNSYGSVSVVLRGSCSFADCFIVCALAFKFNSVDVVTAAAAAAAAVAVVWRFLFLFFFRVFITKKLNATAYGRIFCAFTLYILFSILCLSAVHKSASFAHFTQSNVSNPSRFFILSIFLVLTFLRSASSLSLRLHFVIGCKCAYVTHSQMILFFSYIFVKHVSTSANFVLEPWNCSLCKYEAYE